MKYLYSVIILLGVANVLQAQTRGISYQAVILNPNQQELPGVDAEAGVLPNKEISLRFTIVNEAGNSDYQEIHYVTTDAYGMVNLFIGDGEQLSTNSFDEIDWDGSPKNLTVEIDFEGGNNFSQLSNQKLTFVPFAAHRNITATGTLTVDGQVTFNNDLVIEGTTIFNSDLAVNGNAAVAGAAEIDNDLTVNGLTNLNSNLNVNNASPANLSGTLNVAGTTTLGEQLIVAGSTELNNNVNVAGPVNLADTLNVSGMTLLGNQLSVGGQVQINNDMTVTGAGNIEGALAVNGPATLADTLSVNGTTNLNNALTINNASPVRMTGTLEIDGITTLNNDLAVTGNTQMANLVVRGDGHADGQHIALFENTGGGNADGIAIRIDKGTLSFRNRFITFYGEGDYMAGRIESFDLYGGDTYESFPIPNFATLFKVFDFSKVLTGGSLPSLSFTPGSLPSASLNRGSLPSFHVHADGPELHRGSLPSLTWRAGSLPTATLTPGSFPTLNFDGFFDPQAGSEAQAQIGSIIGWGLRNGYPGFVPMSPWQIALTPVVLAAKQLAMNQGVIYGSKGADYAEWLEKENPDEDFVFGEVVGVKGGKISKVTAGADHVLTISMAPIVLGNMPDEHRKEAFEKVGFMGQLPVLVVGDVEVGDYIVASGNNDGYAVAISPEEIELADLRDIIGKAWSASEGQKISLINVSVGLKTNEWVDIFLQQEEKIQALESKLNDLQSLADRLNELEAKMQNLGVN